MQSEALETEVDAKRIQLASDDDYTGVLEARIATLLKENEILLKENRELRTEQKALLIEQESLLIECNNIRSEQQELKCTAHDVRENIKLFETKLNELMQGVPA